MASTPKTAKKSAATPAKAATRSRSAGSTREEKTESFTAEERAAMKERAAEVRRGRGKADADDESTVLAKIAEFSDADRAMAERVHAVVRRSVPSLTSRLWYGQPAYAKDGRVLCFFQPADKFKTRYSTFGFSDEAALDEGSMWPTSYALTRLTKADEKELGALVKRAAAD